MLSIFPLAPIVVAPRQRFCFRLWCRGLVMFFLNDGPEGPCCCPMRAKLSPGNWFGVSSPITILTWSGRECSLPRHDPTVVLLPGRRGHCPTLCQPHMAKGASFSPGCSFQKALWRSLVLVAPGSLSAARAIARQRKKKNPNFSIFETRFVRNRPACPIPVLVSGFCRPPPLAVNRLGVWCSPPYLARLGSLPAARPRFHYQNPSAFRRTGRTFHGLRPH